MNESKKAPGMSMDEILAQLSSLRENSESFAKDKDADDIWRADCIALEATISMLSILQDEGVNDREGLKDLIFDYRCASDQNKEYRRRYSIATRPVRKDGVWHCPECNHRIAPHHSNCHWCGKKIGW